MTETETTEAGPAARAPRMVVNPPVFFISAALILAFVLFGTIFADQAARLFEYAQNVIIHDFGWFYILALAGFLIFVLFLMISSYGTVKLGPDDSEPEYSYVSWLAMLFSAGMGIGLLFFGVAEPIQHYALPPVGDPRTIESARQAMVLTFFHWGFHGWAVYIVVGLALAYFSFRRGLPLTLRSALFPLIGNRIHGPIGHAIDIFAVLGTMFGVATSLGFGAMQVNAGFNYLFGLPVSPITQIILIVVITGLATISAVAGLDKGIKRLSELNIVLALALLLFVLFAGSTVFLLQAYVQNVGTYFGSLVDRTFRMYAYEPNEWFGRWTLFYWGWWISWSPFVGMFIARISRGRTIREFIAGVLLVPSLFTFFWMTVFGNTAIQMDLNGVAPIAAVVADNLPVALFEMLGHLPLSMVASGLATLLIVTFFVTSADSGALVIDTITSGDADNAPVWQRIFWALCGGAVAAALLIGGGLDALQTAVTASALPFGVVMLFICYGTWRALKTEREGGQSMDLSFAASAPPLQSPVQSWEQRLSSIAGFHDRGEIARFLEQTAHPALDAVATQMRENGLVPVLEQDERHVGLTVPHGEYDTFRYTIWSRSYRAPSFAFAESRKAKEPTHFRAMAQTTDVDQPHDVTGYTRDQLINELVNRYARFRHTRRLP